MLVFSGINVDNRKAYARTFTINLSAVRLNCPCGKRPGFAVQINA